MNVSFQLYSSRDIPKQIDFLSNLAALGYSHVEGFGGVYADPEGFATALEKSGLTMISGHFSVQELEQDMDYVVATATTLGMKMIFAPYLEEQDRPKNADQWHKFALRLANIGKKINAAGFKFGWHNHDFEFIALDSGEFPIDILLASAPNLMWEADLAWVARAGQDPLHYLQKYAGRILSVHIKDIAEQGQKLDEDGWADVGTGTMNWAQLLRTQRQLAPAALCIMEHDNPSDIERFARVSINNLKELLDA
ncbi:MAG: sugar phosphate isomerase/epimerase [Oceanospirillaceae bacterium]|nr:sugar phosphate isomerase/epimerase [Oceanospirillaceae bacterium]